MKTLNTIRLYKTTLTKAYTMCEQGVSYSLEPFESNGYYEGYSDEGTEYLLPEGISLEMSNGCTLEFYKGEKHYSLVMGKNGEPELCGSQEIIKLREVK